MIDLPRYDLSGESARHRSNSSRGTVESHAVVDDYGRTWSCPPDGLRIVVKVDTASNFMDETVDQGVMLPERDNIGALT